VQETITNRDITAKSVRGRDDDSDQQIDNWTAEVGAFLKLPSGYIEIISAEEAAFADNGEKAATDKLTSLQNSGYRN